jgi:hypothetical protein
MDSVQMIRMLIPSIEIHSYCVFLVLVRWAQKVNYEFRRLLKNSQVYLDQMIMLTGEGGSDHVW